MKLLVPNLVVPGHVVSEIRGVRFSGFPFEWDSAGSDDELGKADRDINIYMLMDHIRYKLIKQVGDPIRGNWIEQEYHWRRRQLEKTRADKFLEEYDQSNFILIIPYIKWQKS
jgi:hypothetical protein